MVLIGIAPKMISNAEHLSMYLLGTRVSFLEKHLFLSFAQFLKVVAKTYVNELFSLCFILVVLQFLVLPFSLDAL